MAKRSTSPKQTTPPKGRATPKRDLRPPSRNSRAIIGWICVAVVLAAMIGVAIYIGSGQEITPLGSVVSDAVSAVVT